MVLDRVPLASHEVRWFFDGRSTDHPALRDWFESTDPFRRASAIGKPAWKGRAGDQPDIYLVVPGSNDIGIKWREGELQIKGRVSDLGTQLFGDRHSGSVELWMKWSYPDLPDSYKRIFDGSASDGLLMVPVTKIRALRKVRLDTMTSRPDEVGAKEFIDRGIGIEMTDVEVGGKPYCSLALEAFPNDPAMPAAFNAAATLFFATLTDLDLSRARSESYPRWLNRVTSGG